MGLPSNSIEAREPDRVLRPDSAPSRPPPAAKVPENPAPEPDGPTPVPAVTEPTGAEPASTEEGAGPAPDAAGSDLDLKNLEPSGFRAGRELSGRAVACQINPQRA